MITEKDLVEAIAECQGERNPNANTCIKLAAFYTILNEIRRTPEPVAGYSYAAEPPEKPPDDLGLDSDTEFAQIIRGKSAADVIWVMDELMTAVSVFNPRLYAATLEKLEEL